jgi:dTDP-4-amino-4,6-dideoxygalactose transaminase
MTEPQREEIPVFQPYIGLDTIKAVVDTFHVGWLGMGATTQAFEEAIAGYLGLEGRHVLATNTGTSALHLGLLAAGVGPGDEVITPSFNFVADHQAIVATGATPVFCDVREDTLGLDVDKCAELVGPRTKAVLPLHFAGIPVHLKELYEVAERHGVRVVEDATHAFGTRYGGRRIGSFGDVACFSFDPVKVITAIDGGAVVVGDLGTLERLRHHRLLGIDRDTIERYRNRRAWEYDVVSAGFRYHLTNINASIGLSQLGRVDEFIASRRQACRLYNRLLADLDGLRCPPTDFQEVSPFIYFVRVPAARREGLMEHLRREGIATGIHFLGAHRFSFFKDCRRGDLSVTERIAEEIVTLPLHTFMRGETVERVAEAIRGYLGGVR